MIPGPLISWQLLVWVILLPTVGGLLTLALLVYALQYFLRRKGSMRSFFSWKMRIWCVLVAASCAWSGFLLYKVAEFNHQFALEAWYRQSRERFVLERDFQYGDLLVPKGTLVNRRDAFDNGEPRRPLGLRGLKALRFQRPVQVAGVWVSQLETAPARMTLARDQQIGPVYRYDAEASDWVVDAAHPHADCKAGDEAWFNVPIIDYDIEAEFLTGEPDGAQARFKPQQWRFLRCEGSAAPFKVEPAFDAPPPKGARREVFGPPGEALGAR